MKSEQRARTFFLTINQQAKCYKHVKEIIFQSEPIFYAFILHDKDIAEDGTLKEAHYHVVLSYKNPKTETAVRNLFEGAHEEVARSISNTCKYLLHVTPEASDDGKHQYEISEAISNNPDYFTKLVKQEEFEPFDPNQILAYEHEGTQGLLAYYKRFGASINGYTRLIHELERALWTQEQQEKGETATQDDDLPF
jgi:hypothetical protein